MKDKRRVHNRNRPVLGPDDYKRRRRERRRERALQLEASVQAWATNHGLALRVLNGGHHWILEKSGLVAEWWPSSAKIALNRNYLRTFHAPNSDVVVILDRSAASAAFPAI